MGTGSPHLRPSPLFRDLAQFDTKINCKVELGVLHVGLAPGVLCQGGSLCLSYLLLVPEYFLPQGPPVQYRLSFWSWVEELVGRCGWDARY